MDALDKQVLGWLETFSKVTAMQDNAEALAKEIDTLVTAFRREGAAPDVVDETFRMIKMTSQSRAWPTAAQVIGAIRDVKRSRGEERIMAEKGGDRGSLNSFDLQTLEIKVLPTARRWLRLYPGLRHHAISTLEYWGEKLFDDQGKEYKRGEAK
jgi:hypothetical protein